MAVTFTNQHSPFPSSGNTGTTDGAPLSTRYGKDLMLGCNNLAYTYPWAGFVQSPTVSSGQAFGLFAENFGEDVDEEYFAAQLPTVLPTDGVRFCFTLGLEVEPSGGVEDAILESITLYLCQSTYKYGNADVFDPANLRSPYFAINVPVNLTVTTGNRTYALVDHSAGTTGAWLPPCPPTTGGLAQTNLIITTTGHMDELEPHVYIYLRDFTWWVLPE